LVKESYYIIFWEMIYAILVAAGSSSRMGALGNKLFLPMQGRPIISHTWRQFDQSPRIDQVIVVTQKSLFANFESIYHEGLFKKPYQVIEGGADRQSSVWNGLCAVSKDFSESDSSAASRSDLNDTDIVLIHDGARPFISQHLIDIMIQAAVSHGAAVAAQPMVDTVKQSNQGDWIDAHLDRSKLWAVQTPQSFQLPVILKALKAARDSGLSLTDDTAACDLIDQKVRLVPWSEANPKITHPDDLDYFQFLAEKKWKQ
jgi:2-C-methyl-D-erythritol 4-phosphate cytidylyltransferase